MRNYVSVFLPLVLVTILNIPVVLSACAEAGKWGTNCDKDCHCLGSEYRCNQETAACDSNVCEAGYLNPPTCQTACQAGFFGAGCELECHCVNNEVCNNVNGYCQNGCDPKYTGAGCLDRRTFLGTPPTAVNITCVSLVVTWPQWSKTNAVDVSDIYKSVNGYQLQTSLNGSAWRTEGTYQPLSQTTVYRQTVTNLIRYTSYRFRVRADGQSQWQKPVQGYPGPSSVPVTPNCQGPTPAPTQAPVVAPGPVTDAKAVVTSDSEIRVSWKQPSTGSSVDGYMFTYVKKGIGVSGRCQMTPGEPPTNVALGPTTTERDVSNLDAWSYYEITLYGRNSAGDGEKTVLQATTLQKAPSTSTKVTGVQAENIASTSFTVTWTPLPCDQRNGDLTKYVVRHRPGVGSAMQREIDSTNTRVDITGLTPNTEYSVDVQFYNKHDSTPFSDPIKVTTLNTVNPPTPPSAPRSLELVPRTSSIYATWLPPQTTNGQILEYQVAYRTGSATWQMRTTTNVNLEITGLTTGAAYSVKVQARNSAGWGPYTSEASVTLPAVSNRPSSPGRPTEIDKGSQPPIVRWLQPSVTNGQLSGYKVTYVRTHTGYASASIPSGFRDVTTGTTVILNRLDPASTYSVTIQARNANGLGDASQPLELTTYPPVPPDPNPPQFAMDAQTHESAVAKIFTVTSSNVAHVDVYVRKLTSRRKRSNADCTQNARLQRRILQNEFKNNQIEVLLGDGKTYNGVVNHQLEASTAYEACAKVVAQYKDKMKYSYAKSADSIKTRPPVTGAGVSPWVIVGIVLFLLIIIIIVIIVVLICLLRRKKKKKEDASLNRTWMDYYKNNYERFDETVQKIQPYGRWSDITDFSQARRVEHVREPMDPVDPQVITIDQEYHHLPQGQTHSSSQALKPENDVKNRFEQFLPYDHSRVHVRRMDGGSLYVNANYIDGFQKPRTYIAAQSPFNTETVNDFWEMIYQENSSQIIMMCRNVEDGIMKCEQYWPDDGTRVYRHLAVTLKDSEKFTNYTIRHFDLTPQKFMSKTKTVVQFQFTSWPNHGTPSDPIPYFEFVIKVRAKSLPGSGPPVVHCGTGISRTAVHIAVDALMREGSSRGEISVYNFCEHMRQSRIGMVRTPNQYQFIYDTLFEAMMTSDYVLDFDMRNVYRRLLLKNKRTGRTELLEQFKILRYYTPQINEDLCKNALRSQNRAKNRYLNILAPDEIRVTLHTPGGVERNDYINAIFLDGHTRPKRFIVTQTPLLGTSIDFWKLVYDYKVKTIVMLHDSSYKDDSLMDYWPRNEEMKRYDPFFVTLKSSVKEKDYVVKRYFNLSNAQHRHDKSREVTQYQLFSGWHMYDKAPDRDALLQLIDSVLDEERRLQEDEEKDQIAPIVVHCADGASRSGLFCALMLMIEKMQRDRYIDVFHTVKHIKRRRPQFIDDFDQYKMCFKALWEHVNTRFKSNYSLSRVSKGSHETLDTIGPTVESMLT